MPPDCPTLREAQVEWSGCPVRKEFHRTEILSSFSEILILFCKRDVLGVFWNVLFYIKREQVCAKARPSLRQGASKSAPNGASPRVSLRQGASKSALWRQNALKICGIISGWARVSLRQKGGSGCLRDEGRLDRLRHGQRERARFGGRELQAVLGDAHRQLS